MGEAFDAACQELRGLEQPQIVYEAIAARIIAAAHRGERDPIRLRNAGLAGLGYDSETIYAGSVGGLLQRRALGSAFCASSAAPQPYQEEAGRALVGLLEAVTPHLLFLQ